MESLIQHITTFTTVYFTSSIDTGNRVLDNAVIAILSFFIVQGFSYLFKNWRQIYNCIIYHLYGMYKYPLEIWRAPYSYSFETTDGEFLKEHYSRTIYFLYVAQNMRVIDYSNLIAPLIQKSNMCYLRDRNSDQIHGDKYMTHCPGNIRNSGIYLIAIDSHGNPIYYSTQGLLYYSNRDGFMKMLGPLKDYLVEEHRKNTHKLNSPNEIYTMKLVTNDDRTTTELASIGQICKKKTFDTLFYTQKAELLALLEKFKTKTLYPAHVPMDNKLGILLYGPPGTGKTGTISAVANYLGRSLTIVDFSKINTCEELDKILDLKRYEHTVFVFDEFDCLLDVISNPSQEDKTDWSSMLLMADGEERKHIFAMMKDGKRTAKQQMNLGYLLQKLDGLESSDNRLIIATTNNPDKINTALLRPGRFDLKLCLSNCTQNMYCEILENYYQSETNVAQRVQKAKIPEFKYSPLDILNKALLNPTLDSLIQSVSTN
jgi:predicted AAA+ superfamily ATPase